MLCIVVFNKGLFFEIVVEMFVEVGYVGRCDLKIFYVIDVENDVEFFFF